MKTRHYTIPVFIPMEACPFQCIYCDQEKISGRSRMPAFSEVKKTIEQHLDTIPRQNSFVEVGFFGGTFTGLPAGVQEQFLLAVQPFIQNGKVKSVRLSTRPDFLDQTILDLLKSHHVSTIEIGAQSMDNDVLRKSGRGHNAQQTERAAGLVIANGLRLGLQMMTGLPGDTPEKSLMTARRFVEMGAKDVRIYPTLVIKGTPLEKLYRSGKYVAQSLAEAVEAVAGAIKIFEQSGVRVIRAGLHPSRGLLNGESLVAGPFHVSFRELVNTRLWRTELDKIPIQEDKTGIIISVPKKELNHAIGYSASNRAMLEKRWRKVIFKADESLNDRNIYVDHC
jgi:histone acetyltransferase (RNA polymerase elongator complex component)